MKEDSKLNKWRSFVLERRASFSFTIGSLAYGVYHFLNQYVLVESSSYEIINEFFGLIGGRYFGLIFIILSSVKLYGLITDKKYLKLPIYFALLFLWLLLAFGFFLAFLFGNVNAAWIYSLIIASLSTSVLKPDVAVVKEDEV